MDIYRNFSQVYNVFMEDTPYEKWAGYIDEVFKSHGVPVGGLVLDLACGTGTMAFLMAQRGYELIGVDASADMLSEAYARMQEAAQALHILFLNQDMRALDLYGTVDAAYCSCDSLNYMLTQEDFEKALKNVALCLNPGGVFIFDLKTENKYRELGNNTYYDDMYCDGITEASYIWNNCYNPDTGINEYQVQFFSQQNGEAVTFSETHLQRSYSMETVIALARQAGFGVVSVLDNYTYNPAHLNSERLTYICVSEIL